MFFFLLSSGPNNWSNTVKGLIYLNVLLVGAFFLCSVDDFSRSNLFTSLKKKLLYDVYILFMHLQQQLIIMVTENVLVVFFFLLYLRTPHASTIFFVRLFSSGEFYFLDGVKELKWKFSISFFFSRRLYVVVILLCSDTLEWYIWHLSHRQIPLGEKYLRFFKNET